MTYTEVGPQKGPQSRLLASAADIAVFGGAAGAGKSFAALLEPLRHVHNPRFGAVVFRRTYPEIMGTGGLWDTASELYPGLGATANQASKAWRFPSGATIAFRHLQHETDIYAWQGSQVPLFLFDELTHFQARQFFYMLSRNRSTCGVRPYVRATTNPDAGSWVAEFLAWWIDPLTGFPLPERAGVLRYFYRKGDDIHWYDNPAEAAAAMPELAALAPPKSVTFVPAKLSDNAILTAKDPGYLANLLALPWVERARLLDGNWKVTAADGLFRPEWFNGPVTAADLPTVWKQRVRAWDIAATEAAAGADPDYTAGVLMGRDEQDRYWILDVKRARVSPNKVKRLIGETADADGADVTVVVEQEPGAAGKIVAAELLAELTAPRVPPVPRPAVRIDRPDRTTGDKVQRAFPLSAACERGAVWTADGPWRKAFVTELVQFPARGVHDDQADAAGAAYRHLSRGPARVWVA